MPVFASQPRRILIDCTHTMHSGILTGVQRLVRSLVQQGTHIAQRGGPEIFGVMLGRRGFERYHLDDPLPEPGWRDDVVHFLPKLYVQAANWLCGRAKPNRLRKWLLPPPGHLGAFRLPVQLVERAQRMAGLMPRRGGDLQLDAGDVLLLPDNYWAKMEIWEYVEAARAKGAFTAVVVCDIIPLTHPQFVSSRAPANFKKHLYQVATQADLIVAISRTVRDQLREMLPQYFPELQTCPSVEAFHLGADLDDVHGPVRNELARLFDNPNQANPYITVSTFDPRKNHGFTLDAFELLWNQGADSRLIFVGRRGWMCDDLLRRIETHPRLGRDVFMFHDLSDAELSFCYERARGSITSSAVEGFGLPIIESLRYGRKMFASDTPIHREVGGDHVTYFALTSPAHLASRIAQWEQALEEGAPLRQPTVQPLTWRESTEQVIARCLEAYARQSATSPRARRAHQAA